MEDLIKATLGRKEDEPIETPCEIREGKFLLRGPEDALILPQFWDKLVEPDWRITLYLSSSSVPPAPEDETTPDELEENSSVVGDGELVYEDRIQYMIDYYCNSYDPVYRSSYILKDRVALQHQRNARSAVLPVLQEKQQVIWSEDSSYG
jgi:hypothetical protein